MGGTCGIYKITSPSGRIYIGQSEDFSRRCKEYKNLKCKKQKKLYYSLKKYSFQNHQFDIIEYCSIEDLNCSERFWQDEFNVLGENGLNCVLQECGEKRKVWSEEMKNKQSYNMMGDKNHNFGKKTSEETRKKQSVATKGEKHHMYGKNHTEESIQKMKESSKGQIHTIESIQKRSGENHPQYGKKGKDSINFGRKQSDKVKQERSQAFLGANNPNAKKVIDTTTNIIYNCVEEALVATHVSLSSLRKYLNGQRPNKTTLKYL